MTTALSVMRPAIAKKLKGYISGTTTSAGATDGTTFICSSLSEYSDGFLKNRWALIGGVKRKIDTNFQSNGTVRVLIPFTVGGAAPFTSGVATATAFEIYSIDPDDIKAEINSALKGVFPLLCKITSDETTLETAADTYAYAVPTTITGDPLQIWLEPPTSTDPWIRLLDWNYDVVNVKIRFPYDLPDEYALRLIGITYLTAVTTDVSTTELDEPQIQLIYAMVVAEIYRMLQAGEIGTDGNKYANYVSKWENEAERLKVEQRMVLPDRTLKMSGWTL